MKSVLLGVSFLVALSAAPAAHAQDHDHSTRQATAKPQVVKLSVDDDGYVVTPATVTKGVPVRMEVDLDKVTGCARTVVIRAFGVEKTVDEEDNVIEFTPDKSGEIAIACGMDMVKGSFTVAEPKRLSGVTTPPITSKR